MSNGTLSRDIETFMTETELKNSTAYLNHIQPAVVQLSDCHHTYLKEFLPCFNEDDDNAKAIHDAKSNYKHFLEFFFDNDAKVPNDFKDNHGIEYFSKNNGLFRPCVNIMSTIERNIVMPAFKSNPQISSGIHELRSCIVNVIKTWNNKVLTDLATFLSNLITDDMFVLVLTDAEYEPGSSIFTNSQNMYHDDQVIMYTNLKTYYQSLAMKNEKMLEYINQKLERYESHRNFVFEKNLLASTL